MTRARIEVAIKHVEFARQYTSQFLDDLTPDEWFWRPHEGVTHIGWQIGHLAMAEYALTMIRIRGKEPEDAELISNEFFRKFQKGTTPSESSADMPSPETIRSVFDAVHRQAMSELVKYTDEDLDVRLPEPHALFDTKLGSIFFCGSHEMLHAGQIGLLRRLMGKPTMR